MLTKLQKEFWAGCCDDETSLQAIKRIWEKHQYVCDTHTAVAWDVAEQYQKETGDTRPMVVLSTASPYKFPAAVLAALEDTGDMDEFARMERLQEVSGVPIPENLAGLQSKKERHTGVIEKDRMLSFVEGL